MPNANGLTDRDSAIDALIRFVVSLDTPDPNLCASSLTEDATLDLSPFSKAGMTARVVHGNQQIVDVLMSAVGKPLDTTHCATNVRCTVTGDKAVLTACILAMHFRKGEGPDPRFTDRWENGNIYECDVVRGGEGEEWRLKRVLITPAWSLGERDVMNV